MTDTFGNFKKTTEEDIKNAQYGKKVHFAFFREPTVKIRILKQYLYSLWQVSIIYRVQIF